MTTTSMLRCLQISNKEIGLLLFNLASGKFLRQGEKTATFFVEISQEWSLAQLLALIPPETSTIYIALIITSFQEPTQWSTKFYL